MFTLLIQYCLLLNSFTNRYKKSPRWIKILSKVQTISKVNEKKKIKKLFFGQFSQKRQTDLFNCILNEQFVNITFMNWYSIQVHY